MLLFAMRAILMLTPVTQSSAHQMEVAFMTSFAQRTVDEAIRVRMLISEMLLDRDSTGAEEIGIFSPDEHDVLLRYCVGSKVKHLLRTPPARYGRGSLASPSLRSP